MFARKPLIAFLVLSTVLVAAPPTRKELLEMIDQLRAKVAELPGGEPDPVPMVLDPGPPPTGEREGVPDGAIKVTTVAELVAATKAHKGYDKTPVPICMAAGLYDVAGTGFIMESPCAYYGGYDPSDWTRLKSLPVPKAEVDAETGAVTLPDRLQRFLLDPSASGETILVNSTAGEITCIIGKDYWWGDERHPIDRITFVGLKRDVDQPATIQKPTISGRPLIDLMLIDRHTGGHCYMGAKGYGGAPLIMRGCVVYQPYGGRTGNPRPQVIFVDSHESQYDKMSFDLHVEDCCFIGPVGGVYTRNPNCWNYKYPLTAKNCQFLSATDSRLQTQTGPVRFENCEFWLDFFSDHVKAKKFEMLNCTVHCGGPAMDGGVFTSPVIDLTGTTFDIPGGEEPIPGAKAKGAKLVDRDYHELQTAPLSLKQYNAQPSIMAAIKASYPKLAELP